MVEFLLFCIATVGMTSIITQGVIFQPFRQFFGDWAEKIHERQQMKAQERGGSGKILSPPVSRRSFIEWFNELINCAQCTGFWCGLFCGLFFVSLDCSYQTWGIWFCYGLGGSFLSALGCNLIDWAFYCKMNALRHLEEQDTMLAERRAHAEQNETA